MRSVREPPGGDEPAIRGRRSARILVLWILALGLLVPGAVLACAVCYGAPDSPMTRGMNNGILVLLGFVGLVYVGVGRLFWTIWRRSRKLAMESRRFQVLEGGKR